MKVTITVASADGSTMQFDYDVQQEGDLEAAVAAALDEFRSKCPNASLFNSTISIG